MIVTGSQGLRSNRDHGGSRCERLRPALRRCRRLHGLWGLLRDLLRRLADRRLGGLHASHHRLERRGRLDFLRGLDGDWRWRTDNDLWSRQSRLQGRCDRHRRSCRRWCGRWERVSKGSRGGRARRVGHGDALGGQDDGRDDGWSDVEDNRFRIGWHEACIGRSDSSCGHGRRRVERCRDRICDQGSNRCERSRRHPRLGAGGEFGMRRLHPVGRVEFGSGLVFEAEVGTRHRVPGPWRKDRCCQQQAGNERRRQDSARPFFGHARSPPLAFDTGRLGPVPPAAR